MKIRIPFRLKRAVRLSARRFWMKFYTRFSYLFIIIIIINKIEKWKKTEKQVFETKRQKQN